MVNRILTQMNAITLEVEKTLKAKSYQPISLLHKKLSTL